MSSYMCSKKLELGEVDWGPKGWKWMTPWLCHWNPYYWQCCMMHRLTQWVTRQTGFSASQTKLNKENQDVLINLSAW